MQAFRRTAAVLVILLASGTVGHAAPGREAVADDAADVASSMWHQVKTGAGGLWTAAGSLFATLDPLEYLPEQMPDRDQRFLALMDAAGYRLSAIDTAEGVLGRVRVRFVQQATPSPEDVDRVRRGLAEHRTRRAGSVALAEWRALRGVLAVNATSGYRASAVNLDLLPWPKVSFHVVPRDTGAGLSP
jgi:hypothetical protein